MAAVSDSSPLIVYARAGEFELLRRVFTTIIIPPAVRREVLLDGQGRPGAETVSAATWIVERATAKSAPQNVRPSALDEGEAEAIALALELGGEVPILLDDGAARRSARAEGLEVYGSAGVLGLAKRMGLIATVRPLLDRLLDAGLYLGDAVYTAILAQAGEERAS